MQFAAVSFPLSEDSNSGSKSGIITDLREKLHSAVIGIFENSSRSVKMFQPKIHLGGLFVVQIGFLEILVPPLKIQKS